jgi:hypothetical protein
VFHAVFLRDFIIFGILYEEIRIYEDHDRIDDVKAYHVIDAVDHIVDHSRYVSRDHDEKEHQAHAPVAFGDVRFAYGERPRDPEAE